MKINFKFLIIFFSLGNFLFAQINDNPAYYNPLKKVFDSRDVNLKYSKIDKDKIQLFENKAIIDGIEIEFFEPLSDVFIQILENGLFVPTEIRGNLCCLHELSQINPNPQTKRFSFWTFPKRIENPTDSTSIDYILSTRINPDVYYFELENLNADTDMDLIEFIKGAHLTFFKYGGIII